LYHVQKVAGKNNVCIKERLKIDFIILFDAGCQTEDKSSLIRNIKILSLKTYQLWGDFYLKGIT